MSYTPHCVVLGSLSLYECGNEKKKGKVEGFPPYSERLPNTTYTAEIHKCGPLFQPKLLQPFRKGL